MRVPWLQRLDEPSPAEPEPTFVLLPSGALAPAEWLENESKRCQAREKSLAAQAQAREDDARVALAEREASDRAKRAALRRELPEHLRDLVR